MSNFHGFTLDPGSIDAFELASMDENPEYHHSNVDRQNAKQDMSQDHQGTHGHVLAQQKGIRQSMKSLLERFNPAPQCDDLLHGLGQLGIAVSIPHDRSILLDGPNPVFVEAIFLRWWHHGAVISVVRHSRSVNTAPRR
jgi:hypothetical protein